MLVGMVMGDLSTPYPVWNNDLTGPIWSGSLLSFLVLCALGLCLLAIGFFLLFFVSERVAYVYMWVNFLIFWSYAAYRIVNVYTNVPSIRGVMHWVGVILIGLYLHDKWKYKKEYERAYYLSQLSKEQREKFL